MTILDTTVGIGQAKLGFRFQFEDNLTGQILGDLHPDKRAAPTIEHATDRTVNRTMSMRLLDPDDIAAYNPLRHRVRPYMQVGGEEYPLGVFLTADVVRQRSSSGLVIEVKLVDRGLQLDQATETTTSVNAESDVTTAIKGIAVETGVEAVIEPQAVRFISSPAPIVWRSGTAQGKILRDLADIGGFLPPWFDHHGRLRFRGLFDPAARLPDFDLSAGTRLIHSTAAETSDIWDAPNRFIVIGNGVTESAAVGVYDVPLGAPHSAYNRGGRIVSMVVTMQGAGPGNAYEIARLIAAKHMVFEQVVVQSVADPRHDGYDVVRYEGQNWMEVAWSLPLNSGAAMTHTLRKVYLT